MKRSIGLLALTLALSGTLVACGNKSASTPTAPAVAPDDSTAPYTTLDPDSNNIVGHADNAMRDAGQIARDTIDGVGDAVQDAGDAVRGTMENMEDAARGYGSAYDWNGGTPAEGTNGYPWNAGDAMNSGTYYSYNVQ